MVRRKLGKKGQVASQTVLATFAVAVLIVFLVIFKVTTSVVHAQDIVHACQLSTVLSSWQLQKDLWVMKLDIMDSPFSLDCQTLFTEITKDGINRAEFPVSFGEDATPSEKEGKIKDAIMQEMAQCWYMYGQGRAKVQQAVKTDEGKTTCVVCSEIIPTQEFIDSVQNSKEVLKLDGMYEYAAANKVPPKEDKYYLDYLLENAKTRPDLKSVKEPESIVLDKRYSIVFAVTDQTEHLADFFGGGGVIKANTGIIGCNLGGYNNNPATDDFANAIGCDKSGQNNDGLVFGRVIDGGRQDELLSWKNFVSLGNVGTAVGDGGPELKSFPMTVRLMPTDKMVAGDFCKRLY